MDSSKKLYIIGNGFDLLHGLKTRFLDFRAYLNSKNPNYLDLLDLCYSGNLWSGFEENLSKLDIDSIFSDSEDLFPDEDSDRDGDKYSLEDAMEVLVYNLTTGLRNELAKWILSLDYSYCDDVLKLNIDTNASFMTFNYSDTLERIYYIDSDQITYIHNKANPIDLSKFSLKERYNIKQSISLKSKAFLFEGYDDIIIGHGIKELTFKKPKMPLKGAKTYYALEQGYETICYYDNYKNTEQIIIDNIRFFQSLDKIEEVVIIGHSLSDIDIPYFKEISKHATHCKNYKITYFDDKEKSRIESQSLLFLDGSERIQYIEIEEGLEL